MTSPRIARGLLGLLPLLSGQGILMAATITVTSLADNDAVDGQVTLREALEAANLDTSVDGSAAGSGADQIVFATGPGVVTLNGTPLPPIVDDLTLTGLGAEALAVDGADQSRVFEVALGITAQISDLTVTRGRSSADGAGIWNQGILTISNCAVSASATVTNGGGAFNAGTLTVSNSSFSDNSALNGAGIYSTGTATVTNCTFSGNFNGGIAPFVGGGGGILNAGTLTVVASTFSGNIAGNGGGILNSASLSVTNSTLSANEALNSGGGLWSSSSSSTLINSTLTANRSNTNNDAIGSGGGMNLSSSTVTIHNSLVAGNFNGTGAAASDVQGSLHGSSSFNLVGTSSGLSGITHGTNGNLVGTPGAPIGPHLGPLADNGGLTLTHALLSGSPATDSGDNGLCPAVDQRGVPRPHDGDGDGTATCDRGAFEIASCVGTGGFRLGGRVRKMHALRASAPTAFRNLRIDLAGPGCAGTTMTDGSGEFLFDDLAEGTYTASPSAAPGCRFKPPSSTVTIADSDLSLVFVGLCR